MFQNSKHLVALGGLVHALRPVWPTTELGHKLDLASPKNLTRTQNWPPMIENNSFNYPVSSSRTFEALVSKKQMWEAQIKHMC